MLFLPLVLILASCGIDNYRMLYPPSSDVSSGTTLGFTHVEQDSSSGFLGYIVFYRIYGTSATANSEDVPAAMATDVNKIANAINAGSPESAYAVLTGAKYALMSSVFEGSSAVNSKPFIPIDDNGNPAVVSMNLADSASGVVSINSTEEKFSFFRTQDVGSALAFSDVSALASGDDLDTTGGSGAFRLQAYALAYGMDWTTSTFEIYSLPVLICDNVQIGSQ